MALLRSISNRTKDMELGFGKNITTEGRMINADGSFNSRRQSITAGDNIYYHALISGILYGRFSRPLVKIVFSEKLLVSPYRDGQALMFRLANARKSELLETEVKMVIALNQPDDDGHLIRRFFPLELEFDKISFFSLSWTIVHALTDKSPVYGFTDKDLVEAKAEFLILVSGVDETNQQTLHARRSYTADELMWNARYRT